jgi:hypothetical protein
MLLLSRNRLSTNVLIAILALLIGAYAFGSYLDSRQDLLDQLDSRVRALNDAHATLSREVQLKQFMAGAAATMSADPSAIETHLLHLVGDWEQKTGVVNPSFERMAIVEEHGFTRLIFQISAAGNMGSVAGLLYRVEKSPVPLRVDAAQVRPVKEGADQVQIQLTVSALSRPNTANGSQITEGK